MQSVHLPYTPRGLDFVGLLAGRGSPGAKTRIDMVSGIAGTEPFALPTDGSFEQIIPRDSPTGERMYVSLETKTPLESL
jgi:hypothetical protein